MDQKSVTRSMQLSLRDGAWLAFALLLHGALLLIPLRHFATAQLTSRILSVSLLAPSLQQAVPPPPFDLGPAAQPIEAKTVPPRTNPSVLPAEPPPMPAPPTAEAKPNRTTAARLVDSASRLKWSLPNAAEDRQLGVSPPREIPGNWRPGIEVEDNLFNGMVKPAKMEIVDNWLAADGSQNIVVTTPSGETVCGRALAWDPMNPLVEHIMTWRPCGGGGERAFKMPDRFMKHLVD